MKLFEGTFKMPSKSLFFKVFYIWLKCRKTAESPLNGDTPAYYSTSIPSILLNFMSTAHPGDSEPLKAAKKVAAADYPWDLSVVPIKSWLTLFNPPWHLVCLSVCIGYWENRKHHVHSIFNIPVYLPRFLLHSVLKSKPALLYKL